MKNQTFQEQQKESKWLSWSALICLMAGWLVAVLIGGGLELHRSAVAVPLVGLAALLGLTDAIRSGRAISLPLLIGGGPVLLYFAARAIFSEVWDLGRHDLHLLSMAWLTLATVSTCAIGRRERLVVFVGIVGVLGMQLLAGLYQYFFDPGFTFFRHQRPSSEGVSGLFWQWNNLAGLLAITMPLCAGLVLCRPSWIQRGPLLLLVLLGIWLAWLTRSRAGFAAMTGGIGCACAILVFLRVRSRDLGAWVIGCVAFAALGLVALAVVMLSTSALSEERGQDSDVGNLLGSSSRLGLAAVAFEIWQEKPLFGNGSQSYRYLAVQHWDTDIPSWVNDPELAHSEYLQVLCDYGMAGLILIVGFLLIVVVGAVVRISRSGSEGSSLERGLGAGCVGAMAGGMLHAAFDFQTHLLPILMLAALVTGLLFPSPGVIRATSVKLIHGTLVVLMISLGIFATGKETLHMGQWLKWEKERATNYEVGLAELPRLRQLVEDSPHYFSAELYGRLQLSVYARTPEELRSEMGVCLQEARWGLEIAQRRHPQDARALVELGLVYDLLGNFDKAADVHREAIRVARRRERKFGAFAGLSHHLALRGKELWYSRRPEKALGCFLLSREYLELSIRRGYRFSQPQEFRQRREILGFYIKSLQDGKIRPDLPDDILNRFPRPADPEQE